MRPFQPQNIQMIRHTLDINPIGLACFSRHRFEMIDEGFIGETARYGLIKLFRAKGFTQKTIGASRPAVPVTISDGQKAKPHRVPCAGTTPISMEIWTLRLGSLPDLVREAPGER